MKTLNLQKEQYYLITKNEVVASTSLVDEELFITNNKVSVCRVTTKNTIKFCNTAFIQNSGYSEKELLKNSINSIAHPKMPKIISDFITYHLKKDTEIGVIIKNKAKDGRYFWNFSTFIPNNTRNLNLAYTIKYTAISSNAKKEIDKLYTCLYKIETKNNEKTAYKYLIGYLEERCMSLPNYMKYLVSL